MNRNSVEKDNDSSSSSQLHTPPTNCCKLRLNYFHIRGNCQPVRHLFYYLGIDFEDIRHAKTQENNMDCRFNMGLPMLEDGNYKIYDAVAIMVHLAKKHKMESLIGLTPQHRGRINEVLFKFSLQRKRIMLTILEGLQIVNKEEDQQSKVDTFLLKLLSDCKFVDFCVKAISKTKTFIFDKLSLVDFIFFELTFYLLGFFRPFLTEMSPLYCLIDYKSQFQSLPFYQQHKHEIDSVHLFLEFSQKKINKFIMQAWRGEAVPLIRHNE